jgi:hypothetical protein
MMRLAISALLFSVCATAHAQTDSCDRECLRGVLMRYMTAVADNAPDEAGIIVGFRQTENAIATPVGAGAWRTVTALGDVYRHYLDPVSGQAAYFGIVEESRVPAVVTARVLVAEGQVIEAEWYIGRARQPGMRGEIAPDGSGAAPYDAEYFIANPPPPERNVPLGQRLSRQSLVGVTNSYFDALTTHDPAVMLSHPTCKRIENGMLVTGRVLEEGRTDGYQGRTNCSSGILTTGTFNIANVAARRYPLVDEQQQVVLGMVVFIRNRESVNRRLGLSEFFYIDDELISEVHAAMFYAAADVPMPNWPPYEANFPLSQR